MHFLVWYSFVDGYIQLHENTCILIIDLQSQLSVMPFLWYIVGRTVWPAENATVVTDFAFFWQSCNNLPTPCSGRDSRWIAILYLYLKFLPLFLLWVFIFHQLVTSYHWLVQVMYYSCHSGFIPLVLSALVFSLRRYNYVKSFLDQLVLFSICFTFIEKTSFVE